MRWKLILITSFVGAFVAGGAWCLFTIAGFGQFSVLFSRPWIASLSLIIPILLSTFAAIFVYRHTAQRRKTQALLTMILTLLLTFSIYIAFGRYYQGRYYQGRFSMVTLPQNQLAADCS